MVLCSVPWCKNRSDQQNWKRNVNEGNGDVKISFHSIPKDATTCSLWFHILGINSPSIPSGARICSKHFEEKFIDRSSPSVVRLKPNAFPCVKTEVKIEPAIRTNLLDTIMERQNESSNPDQHSGREALREVHHSQTLQASSSVPVTSILKPSTSEIDEATMVSPEDCFKIRNKYQPSIKPLTSTVDKSTMTSFELVHTSPEECRLRKRLKYVKEESRKKIRSLQQNLRRHNDKITTLKSLLKMLREKRSLDED